MKKSKCEQQKIWNLFFSSLQSLNIHSDMGNFIPIFDLNWKLLTNRMKVYFKKSSIQNLKKKISLKKFCVLLKKTNFYLHLQLKFKLLAGKFTLGNTTNHCWVMFTNFFFSKVTLCTSSKLSRLWIFTEADGIESRLPSKIFSTLHYQN